jgi:hypothetical protein
MVPTVVTHQMIETIMNKVQRLDNLAIVLDKYARSPANKEALLLAANPEMRVYPFLRDSSSAALTATMNL